MYFHKSEANIKEISRDATDKKVFNGEIYGSRCVWRFNVQIT